MLKWQKKYVYTLTGSGALINIENVHPDCPDTCIERHCRDSSSVCIKGCITGYYGRNCSEACSLNCADLLCDWSNGKCQTCLIGWYGDTCDVQCHWCIG